MRTWLSVVLAALATVAVLALLWIGGELHRQSCIADHSAILNGKFTLPAKASSNNPGVVSVQISRNGSICSRKPW